MFLSGDSENRSNWFRYKLTCRTKCGNKRTNYWQYQNFNGLISREEVWVYSLQEEILLHSHCKASHHAYKYSKHTWRKHQNQSLIEVEKSDPVFGYTNCSEDANFLWLVVKICTHGRSQREKAQKHHNANRNGKYAVQDAKNLIYLFLPLVIFCYCDGWAYSNFFLEVTTDFVYQCVIIRIVHDNV